MTNEELKKKIVEVVLNSEITGIQIRAITGGYSMANNIADALIEAGIGDVKETEHRAEKVEKAFRNFLAEYFTAVNEQSSYDCGIPEMFGRYANVLPYEDIVTSRLNEYLDEAEREIEEEERKDD